MDNLPDLCIIRIFDYLELNNLVQIGRVCSRWTFLQKTAIKRRKSLTFQIGTEANKLIETSFITIPFLHHLINQNNKKENSTCNVLKLTSFIVHRFATSTPVIHSLKVMLHEGEDFSSIQNVLHLVRFWSPKLVSFQLYLKFASESDVEQKMDFFRQLFLTLNDCTKLKHLTLDISDKVIDTCKVQLSILHQLKEFYFFSHDSLVSIVKLLKNCPNLQVEKIGIGNEFLDQPYDSLLQLGSSLLSKLTHSPNINFPLCANTFDRISTVQQPFTRLKRLSVDLGQLSLHQLAKCLSSLQNLIYIHLTMYFGAHHRLLSESINHGKVVSPLLSVRILSIEAYTQTCNDLSYLEWPLVFPSVEVVRIYPQFVHCTCSSCLEPDFSEKFVTSFIDHKFNEQCVYSLAKPWKSLPKLRKVLNSITKENML